MEAAAKYLSDSYAIFGDWQLAIASYNCGPGNVNKAMKRSGKHDIWDIYYYLPRETRGYVPAFTGALYALNYYREYGIEPERVDLPAQVDTFHVNKMLHFKQVSELTGVPIETLKLLNPQYTHDRQSEGEMGAPHSGTLYRRLCGCGGQPASLQG